MDSNSQVYRKTWLPVIWMGEVLLGQITITVMDRYTFEEQNSSLA